VKALVRPLPAPGPSARRLSYHACRWSPRSNRFQSIDPALLDIGPDDNVIDLGCGMGRHVLELSRIPSNIIGGHVRWYEPGQMRRILEESGMTVEFERRRHASQSLYWFLRCIHGLPNENFPPVRLTWKLINVHHNRRIKMLEWIETVASLVIGKDLIHYGHKRADVVRHRGTEAQSSVGVA
jgi:hypothetical protein